MPARPSSIAVQRRVTGRWPALAAAAVLAFAGPSCAPSSGRLRVPPPAPVAQSPADQLYELSPARVQIRRLGPQSLRLLAPHWSRIRQSDRTMVQATLYRTLSEERVAPLVRERLRTAVEERPELAAEALAWLRGPIGYEVKFAEATAWSGDKSSDAMFYATVAAVRDSSAPQIRLEPIRRLARETRALDKALETTAAVGTVVARLVNVTRPDSAPLPVARLEDAIAREKRHPDVVRAYEPVTTASLLVRCRDLDLQELDSYIAFASTEAGRWYHDTLAAALQGAVADASADVEERLEAAALGDAAGADVDVPGVDLDSLLVSLPSGREVRLLTFAQGGEGSLPSIMLRYETTLSLADATAVGREADEVWNKVRDQIASEGVRAAVLQATGSVEGWVFPFASSRKYAWQREDGGEWVAARGVSRGAVEREMLWSSPP